MMVRRTTSWPARNKQYVFFLFNDILIWTTNKGMFQNVVALYSCELQPWENTSDPKKKFKLVARRDSQSKILLLECKSPQNKSAWYSSLELAIQGSNKAGKEPTVDLPSAIKYEDSDDEKTLSNEAPKSNIACSRIKRVNRESMVRPVVSSHSSLTKNHSGEDEKKHEHDQEDSYYDYEASRNLTVREFHGFDPFDDNSSQISESEFQFYEENSSYRKIKTLSPSRVSYLKMYPASQFPPSIQEEPDAVGPSPHLAHISANESQRMLLADRNSCDSSKTGDCNDQKDNSPKMSKIIRSPGRDEPSVYNSALNSSTLTISLNDLELNQSNV